MDADRVIRKMQLIDLLESFLHNLAHRLKGGPERDDRTFLVIGDLDTLAGSRTDRHQEAERRIVAEGDEEFGWFPISEPVCDRTVAPEGGADYRKTAVRRG